MKLNLIILDEVAEHLPEVTFPKPLENRKFAKKGLFSQQIFGPQKSYHCACTRNSYKGPRYESPRCPVCDVEITTSEKRKRQFAKIKLPFPVLNPLFFYLLVGKRPALRRIVMEMLTYQSKYYFDGDGIITKLAMDENTEDGVEYLQGLDGALLYIKFLLKMYIPEGLEVDEDAEEEELRPELKYVKEHFDQLTTKTILVIPPEFRPCGKLSRGNYISDDINKQYQKIIKISNELKSIPFTIEESSDVYITNFRYLQKLVIELYDFVMDKMSKKSGLIRSNILGKRVDFSGRAVISPDPTLKIDECRLPYWMVLEILKPNLISHLVNKRVCKRYNQAIKLIDESIQNNDPRFFEIVSAFCENRVCVLNRQPTLHRLGVLGFKIRIHLGNTIQIHPMICHPYNADFDGDAMAVYMPITKRSIADVHKNLGIWANLISPTDMEAVPRPNQDIILGVYAATTDESDEHTHHIKGKELSFGKYAFNACLPDDYELIEGVVRKTKLNDILNDITLRYPPAEVMEAMDNIKNLGFTIATLKGYTLSLTDLYDPELTRIAHEDLSGDHVIDLPYINNDPDLKAKLRALPFSVFIESGARGTWDQARQMVFARGYVADANNQIRPRLIRSSLVEGLTPTEFFDSCWGSRKGLLDTALSTGDTGYLTRQLIYSTVNMELGDIEDCGTTDGIIVKIDNENIAKSYLWRYMIKKDGTLGLITHSNYKQIIGKVVKLRSPIHCTSSRVCKTCYGKLCNVLHSDQIGIIATQAVGERATQLVLRTFHISGSAAGIGADGENDDIISGMGIAKKLFHNPKEIIKDIKDPVELVNMIYKVFGQYGTIKTVHFEVIVAAMMWSGEKLWRLVPNRNSINPEYISILQVPSRSSWLLGCAFSNLKQKVISGLIDESVDTPSALTAIFRY